MFRSHRSDPDPTIVATLRTRLDSIALTTRADAPAFDRGSSAGGSPARHRPVSEPSRPADALDLAASARPARRRRAPARDDAAVGRRGPRRIVRAMTTEAGRRRARRTSGGIAQLPWRTVRNPYRPIEILSADEVETLHRASLRILAEIGVEVLGDRAHRPARAERRAPSTARRRNVRLDPGHVEELVALAPSTFRLHARNPERRVLTFGDGHVVFSSSAGRRSSPTSTAAGGRATTPTSSTTSA